MFEEPLRLGLGLLTGIAFGFLLQKGRVAKYHVILGQLLLKDWTVVKIIGTAAVVGSIGIYALVEMDAASLHIKPVLLGGIVVGGLLFGAGMALLGYCPGTSVAACGEGRRDAMVGVVGMLVGAGLFVALYPAMQTVMQAWGDWGKTTLAGVLDTSPWLIIALLLAGGGLAVWLLERRGGPRTSAPITTSPAKRTPG